MANVSTDVLSLVACSERTVISLDDFAQTSAQVRSAAARLVNEQLNSLDLFDCVIDLSDTAVAEDVKVFMQTMVNKHHELVFLGLAQSVSKWILCCTLN